jgi:5-methyltetrahydrofolate--homocysteine methyltransferase
MDGPGIPETAGGRLAQAVMLIEKLRGCGFSDENIYMDALAGAVAADYTHGLTALKTLSLIHKKEPRINMVCGLSNISYGLPNRAKLNAAFLMMAMQNGLTSVIADVLSKEVWEALILAETLLGQDDYCMAYIGWYRDEQEKKATASRGK